MSQNIHNVNILQTFVSPVLSSLWIRTQRHSKRFLARPIHLYPHAMNRLFEYFHASSQIARLEGRILTLVAFPASHFSHLFTCHVMSCRIVIQRFQYNMHLWAHYTAKKYTSMWDGRTDVNYIIKAVPVFKMLHFCCLSLHFWALAWFEKVLATSVWVPATGNEVVSLHRQPHNLTTWEVTWAPHTSHTILTHNSLSAQYSPNTFIWWIQFGPDQTIPKI